MKFSLSPDANERCHEPATAGICCLVVRFSLLGKVQALALFGPEG